MFVSVESITILRGITINTMIISEGVDLKRLHPEFRDEERPGMRLRNKKPGEEILNLN
jgi:hypothetical protein